MVSTAISNALAEQRIDMALLYEIEFPSETVRAWSGRGSISYGGKAYTGDKRIIGFDKIAADDEQSETSVIFSMPFDPDSQIVKDIRDGNEAVHGGAVAISVLFFVKDTLTPVGAIPEFIGTLDAADTKGGGKDFVVEVAAVGETWLFKRFTTYNLTDGAQQEIFPGDRGLEFATNPQNTRFGSGATGAYSGGGSSGGDIRRSLIQGF